MNLIFLLNFLLLAICTQEANARNKCVKVVGRIHCATDWDRHYDVKIWLMDKDRKFLGFEYWFKSFLIDKN